MLTGETTPQLKSAIEGGAKLDLSKNKPSIIFGGTKIEQLISNDGSITCYALSTGLGSSQGRLIRTILYASEKVRSDTRDALYLLGFLSTFALAAGGYVWFRGIRSKTISTFRLIVEILLIFSSTIPPDLTTELSITINSSLLALTKLKGFCTEPYRIPYAGSIDVCCFDKTGTLTADEYRMVGIDDMSERPVKKREIVGKCITDDKEMPIEALWVIGGCQSLVRGKDGQLIGDSVEATAFNSTHFSLTKDGMSPQQKARVVIKLKNLGYNVMMCGDGTNDVGAIKQSDVGLGLLEKSLDEAQDIEGKPKLGAASIASPFVSKRPTVSATIDALLRLAAFAVQLLLR